MPRRPDVEMVRLTWEQKRANPTATQEEIAETIGLDPRTVANYVNPKWLSKRNFDFITVEGVSAGISIFVFVTKEE